MIDYLQLDKEEILKEFSSQLLIENHSYLVYLYEQFICFLGKNPGLDQVDDAVKKFIDTI